MILRDKKTKTEKQQDKVFWLIYVFIAVLALTLMLLPSLVKGQSTGFILDDLESYDVDSTIGGQGDWWDEGIMRISDTVSQSGSKSMRTTSSNYENFGHDTDDSLTQGTQSFWFYPNEARGTTKIFTIRLWHNNYYNGSALLTASIAWDGTNYKIRLQSEDYLVDGVDIEVNHAEWNSFEMIWDSTAGAYGKGSIRLNGNEIFSDIDMTDQAPYTTPTRVIFRTNWDYNFYLDSFGGAIVADPSVDLNSPASGTEITDLDQNITVNYSDLDDYDTLYLAFRHPFTQISTDAKTYEISNIGGSGQLEIPLTDFNIEKNGNWYLTAIASYEGYQYEGEYFLGGYGSNWTDELTNGTDYLDINIDGYEEIFAMSDFESWYNENSQFDSPTDMFVSITGFFSPVFSRVGEFGNRITNYFETDQAFSQGRDIGKAIPVFTYYVGQIGTFLGGFPVIKWFMIGILILVGIFIFKVIFKFIPFLG